MQSSQVQSAVSAAEATASALGLKVDDAIILQNSNRLAVHLQPCDVLARVARAANRAGAEFEVELARRLAASDSPVAGPDPKVEPRVYVRDGFAVTFWTYYEPDSLRSVAPAEYAHALKRLHAGMRGIDLTAPHFTDRVGEAQRLVGSIVRTPALEDSDRELLGNTLGQMRKVAGQAGAREQLLHGEPHPGNLLRTKKGLLFVDLETCCRGPVEFDVAHAPDEVGEHYPGVDPDLLGQCRMLKLAMVAAWRWDRDDQFPNGRLMGAELIGQLRAALDHNGWDATS